MSSLWLCQQHEQQKKKLLWLANNEQGFNNEVNKQRKHLTEDNLESCVTAETAIITLTKVLRRWW